MFADINTIDINCTCTADNRQKAKWKALLVAVSCFGKTVACFRRRDSRVREYEKLGTF